MSISSIARVAAGALILSATSALAADLPSRKVAPVAPIVPAFTWTGFYLGADLGGAFGYSKNDVWVGGVSNKFPTMNSSGRKMAKGSSPTMSRAHQMAWPSPIGSCWRT